jgi:ubiquinone/menaquinone biosynthesis C-methylase UbiE
MWVATKHEYDSNAFEYNKKRRNYLVHTHTALLSQIDWLTIPPTSILEIGSGTGLLAGALHQKFPKSTYLGIELSQWMIDQTIQLWLPSSYEFVQGDFIEYEFDNKFECIISSSVLHFMDTELAIQKMYDLLLPWWTAIILDWCNDGLFKPIDWWIRTFGSPDSHAVSSSQMNQYTYDAWFTVKNHQTGWRKYWCLQCIVLQKG